jgi:Protein of unknown function (DUF3558)
MSRRTLNNVVAGTAIAVFGLVSLAGCKIPGKSDDKPATTSGATASGSPGVDSGSSLPDICTLLSKEDVAGLTGHTVTQMSNEGGNSSNARYCQWQLTEGQLNVQVDNETREQFDVRNQQSNTVDGVGETAYTLAGHLYVYQAGKVVDVYATSSTSDSANLDVEKETATKILAKLK